MELTLQIKLASILVHLEEMFSLKGHDFDKETLLSLLDDPEIRTFLKSIDPVYLPVKR